jgi:CMP/dCMP kinase
MTRSGPIITIDGPAGAGKSTIARKLARMLEFALLDTGAIYRALTLGLMRAGIDPDRDALPPLTEEFIGVTLQPSADLTTIFLHGEDVSDLIRNEDIAAAASKFSAMPDVRSALLSIQRGAARDGGVIAEERDMGTVVFPDAEVKFFLSADLEARAARRYAELCASDPSLDPERVLRDMAARDARDESRSSAPLVVAPDAHFIDTTRLSPTEVIALMMDLAARTLPDFGTFRRDD